MKNAVGKAITNPNKNDFNHLKIKSSTRPIFNKVKAPDIINAIKSAIKNGNNILGFFINFFMFN